MLRDKAFDVVKNLKHDTYQRGFASIVYNLFYKESSDGATKSKIFLNQCPLLLARIDKVSDRTRQLAAELHQLIIKKFEKRKV